MPLNIRTDFLGTLFKRGGMNYTYEESDEYSLANSGFTGDYEYFGYLTTTGNWIIQRHQITLNEWMYVAGSAGYSAFRPFSSNLSAIGALNYVTFDAMFS